VQEEEDTENWMENITYISLRKEREFAGEEIVNWTIFYSDLIFMFLLTVSVYYYYHYYFEQRTSYL